MCVCVCVCVCVHTRARAHTHTHRQCGFTAVKTTRASPTALDDLGVPADFDAVFALNVLDRVPDSDAFLDNLVALTQQDGLLIVALPLPYCAKPWSRVDRGPEEQDAEGSWSQKNALSLHMDPALSSPSWEQAARGTVERLRGAGLSVERVVRAPYLCQGHFGASGPLVLDGAVFVMRKDGNNAQQLHNCGGVGVSGGGGVC